MLRVWGYLSLLVLILAVSLFTISSIIDSSGPEYTGAVVAKSGDDTLVLTCPENRCPGEDDIEGCKETLGLYEGKVENLEMENEMLEQKMGMLIVNDCEPGGGDKTMEDARELSDHESVRNFAVFLISSSEKDTVTSLYDYVRNNVRFVSDPDKDYVASACETLLSGGGDCEDHAILLASMLEAVGVDAKILWLPEKHAFVGIVSDADIEGKCKKFLYMEDNGEKLIIADTTFSNCMGQISEEYVAYEGDEWEWKEKPKIIDV